MEFAFELDACVCAYEDAAGVKVSKISLRSTLWPIHFDDDCDVDFDHDLMMIVMLILMMIIVMMTIMMMRLMMMLMELLMI